MALEFNVNKKVFTASPGQTVFSFGEVLYFDQEDLMVYVDGTLKSLGTHYTVDPTTNTPNGTPGGTVTLITPMSGGEQVVVLRQVDLVQEIDYEEFGKFPANTHERGLDYLTMIAQQHEELLDRCLRAPVTESGDMVLPPLLERANKAFGWDSSGLPIAIDPLNASGDAVTASGSYTARLLAERFAEVVNVKDFGAVGDGVTDDTVAIQAAIDVFSGAGGNWVDPTKSGTVFFPRGVYKVTSTLLYNGGSSYGITLKGVHTDLGASGSVIRWLGSAGGTPLKWVGANGSKLIDLQIDGAQSSHNVLYGFHIDATNDTAGSAPGSHDLKVERCVFYLGTYANGACVALGHTTGGTTPQVSEVAFEDCYFGGNSVGTAVLSLVGGNAKNYSISGGTITHLAVGIDWSPANTTTANTVRDVMFLANATVDVKPGTGATRIESCRSEGSAKFITAPTGNNPETVSVEDCYWVGSTVGDDYIITTGGGLKLARCYFRNNRTGSSIPKIQCANVRSDSGNGYGALISEMNAYYNATNVAGQSPFEDTSGNELFTPGAYYDANNIPINGETKGDRGGTDGAPVQLTNYIGTDKLKGTWTPSVGGNATYTVQYGSYVKHGKMVTVWGRITINVLGTGSTKDIAGLPFISKSSGYGAQGSAYWAGAASAVVTVVPVLPNNSTGFSLYSLTAANATLNNSNALFQNGATIQFTLTYEAA